jgi:hypothetical protein
MHDIHDEHSHVAKTATTRAQVSERLVAGSVNDKEPRNFKGHRVTMLQQSQVLLEILWWEVSRTNLLSDTTGLASLHIGLAEFVQNFSLSSIDVTHNANDGATQFACLLTLLLFCSSLSQQLLLSFSALLLAVNMTVKSSPRIFNCSFPFLCSSSLRFVRAGRLSAVFFGLLLAIVTVISSNAVEIFVL